MTATPSIAKPTSRVTDFIQRQGALIALVALIVFGALRYDGFFAAYNFAELLRYNSMFGLVALGMTFVIMTGGIDLSVGSVAALASVLAAQLSPHGLWIALFVPMLATTALGFINGLLISSLKILPFIVTLASLLAARGLALLAAGNQSVSVATDTGFTNFGQGNVLGLPIPGVVMFIAFLLGVLALAYSSFGRHVLAVGGNEEASRLMGLSVDQIKIGVYTLSGALAGLAGVILASQFGAGQPTEGSGWELAAIASVVVGGTLLTGGRGSVGTTLVGVLLLGLIFNVLNFENGRGVITLSSYWQSVIRGGFLLVVVILQIRLAKGKN